jgi:heme-degrading monooxygenase HmoA
MAPAVAEAFQSRPHLVDQHPGFLRMEVISPEEQPKEFWLMTYWTSRTTYEEWHHSHHYRDSHAGMPKGLKLDPTATELRYFTHIAG